MNAGDLNAEIKILARFVSEDAAIRLGRSLSERFGNAETDDLVPA
jgi:hypothetical protein